MASRTTTRRGFTLIEIMVVVAIIGLLMAFVLPAIMGSGQRAREGRVGALFGSLDLALGQFRERYGMYPPSRITLHESGDYSAAASAESRNLLRRLWPRIAFSTDTNFTAADWNFDGNSGTTNTYTLNGAQCLVFFLGGPPDPDTHVGLGFSRDPFRPFRRLTSANTVINSIRRDGPFYEFRPAELVENGAFHELADPLQNGRTIAYFSSYKGLGYRPTDCQFSVEQGLGNACEQSFTIQRPWWSTASPPAAYAQLTSVDGPNPYTLNDPHDGGSPPTRFAQFYNPKGYQLISAGQDGVFGRGGEMGRTGQSLGDHDLDNLANFVNGRLSEAATE